MIKRPRKAPMPIPTFALVESVEAGAEMGGFEGFVDNGKVSEGVMIGRSVTEVAECLNPLIEGKVY